jgi:hypothetical protein
VFIVFVGGEVIPVTNVASSFRPPIVCPILRRLSEAGLDYTWNSVRNLLSSHDRVVTAFNTEDGHCVFVKNTTSANLSQKIIYNELAIKHDPLKNVYFKRKVESTAQK